MRTNLARRTGVLVGLLGVALLSVAGAGTATGAVCGPAAPLRFAVEPTVGGPSAGYVISVATDGTVVSTVPVDLTGFTDIAMREDHAGYWAVDTATGALESIDIATGAISSTGFTTQSGDRGLALRPGGHLIADDGTNMFDLDPLSGVTTPLGISLPAGLEVDGDYGMLPDGRVLVAAWDTVDGTVSHLVAFDPASPSTAPIVVGRIPTTWAIAVFDGVVYLGTSSGDIYRLDSIPTVASTANLPITLVADLPAAEFYGGAALPPVACPASLPTPPPADPTLAETGAPAGVWVGAGGLLVLGGIILAATGRRRRTDRI